MINVIANIPVKAEYKDEFIAIFQANVPAVQAEDGCIRYTLTADVDTGFPVQEFRPNVLTVVEAWESLDHLKAHLAAPHMAAYKEKTANMTDGSVVLQVTEAV